MIETKLNLSMHYWKSMSYEERQHPVAKWFRVTLEIATLLLRQRNELEQENRVLRKKVEQ